MTHSQPFRCAMLMLMSVSWCNTARAQWVNAPSAKLVKSTPGLVHESFQSQAMNAKVGYCVVLPEGYGTSNRRYPVVYWLHGGGGNECSSLFTAQAWQASSDTSAAGDVILVYPSAFRSGYMDHIDGKVMVESMIIQELIPRIDQRYRTVASRTGRAVHGFSMGSSGALKFAIKYPDLFCAAAAYGGGAIDLQNTEMKFVLDILERNLKSNPDLIRQNNTYYFLNRNQKLIRKNKIQFALICGQTDSWKESAIEFDRALRDRNIPCELTIVPNVAHNMRGLFEAEGRNAAQFQDRVFRTVATAVEAPKSDASVTFNATYFSRAEGKQQPFQVTLPPDYSTQRKYPLVVQQYGSASMLPTRARPFIRVHPSARGVWGFRSMSRFDVMEVIRHAVSTFSVDKDRVYMMGTSAGATGIMQAAAYRPDVFAGLVPLVAFGTDLPLENFCNLPIRCEHGVNDWTSSIGNVRVQFQKLGQLGYDAVLHEHPSAGHGIRIPPKQTMDWLFALRRNRTPNRIVYSCEHPRDGRAYWTSITEFIDPHRVARVEARAESGRVDITTENVSRLSINRVDCPLREEGQLVIDGTPVEASTKSDNQTLELVRDGGWRVDVAGSPTDVSGAYGAGAAANLFQGEPLLVVYGTGADADRNKFLRKTADLLARCGGPTFKSAGVRFPVRADTDLDDLPLEKFNLLLVGKTLENSYLRNLAARLPLTIENGVLSAGDRQPLQLKGSVLSLFYRNPDYPQRCIYVVSPYLGKPDQLRFLKNPRVFLAGSEGFQLIDQPDLIVRGADLCIRREMQLGADWKFVRLPGEERIVPSNYSLRENLAFATLKVMQKSAKVDFGLWWGPEDKGLFGGYDFNWLPTFDPDFYTLADYSIRRRATETMTASLSGEELLDIYDRWIASKELVTWPKVEKQNVQADSHYSIVIPMDLVPKLGIRRRVLSDVATGPEILPKQVADVVFGKTE